MMVEMLGYIASALVFVAFYMRTMLPLRWVAIASNVAFISYGVPLQLWPVVILHAVLLPLNLIRLFQIRRLLARIEATRGGGLDLGVLGSSLRPESYPAGTTLFVRGDRGDVAYLLDKGEVNIPELQIRLGGGQLFGEVALLSPDGMRTASAVCLTDVELYRIDAAAITRAFHQDPAFAVSLMRLVTGRLVENLRRLEAAHAIRPG